MGRGIFAGAIAWLSLVAVCMLLWLPNPSFGADTLCARVKIEIKQELTLERQAFDAHMRINNGLAHIILEDVVVDVSFKDKDGNTA